MDKKRILVVEDERIVAMDLEDTLAELGYQVVAVVPSGEQALELAQSEAPDLVLMDIVLEGALNGVDTASRMRELDLPVVYLTAYADESTVERAKLTEPFGYLVKPFEVRELRTTIEMALYKHRMESKLRRSEQWLDTTLRSIGDAVIATDTQGRVRLMNAVAEALTGWSQDDASDRPLEEVFRIINEETRQEAENPVARALREGRVVGLANHTVLISRQGIETPIADSAAPIRDRRNRIEGVVLVFRDITEERRTQRALAAEKELLAVTLRSIGDGVIVTDPQGIVTAVNRVAEALTGWPETEARGRPLPEVFRIVDDQTRQPAEDPVARVNEADVVIGLAQHITLIARDGTERSIADSGAPIHGEDSTILGVVLVFRDVTEQRRVEAELQRVQKLESVGVLAGGIAHDFNNILMAIMGNISMSKLSLDPEHEVCERLDEAELACNRAKTLTQQLLTFSRGGAPLKLPTAVPELVRESLGFALRGSNVHAAFEQIPGLWPILADVGQMTQVFSNLAINAKQAMPTGGEIVVEADNTILEAGNPWLLPPARYVRLSFRDEGIGIAEDHLQRIFDPYFTTKQRGSGLGLAVCHSIVKAHGGAISAESKLGEGTRFLVHLPASEAIPRPGAAPETLAQGQGRLLVMDDERSVRELLVKLLTRVGYRVESAAHGAAALRLFRSALEQGNPFDAAILDLTVPGGMGGLETLRHLRRLDPDVKAIVSSGYSNDAVIADHQQYGFRAAVVKPFDLGELSRHLEELIGQS